MKNTTWSIASRILVSLTGWIAFPVIVAVFIGKWLDKRYGTEPWLFLITVGVAFLISMFGLMVNAIREFKKIEQESRNQKNKN